MRFLGSPSSLRWRLSWRLSLVQGGILVIVNVGCILYLLSIFTLTPGVDRAVLPILTAAIGEQDGELAVVPTREFRALAGENPRLWFRALDDRGRSVSFGEIPGELTLLADRLDTLVAADVRANADSALTAFIETTGTASGNLRIFFGGRTEAGSALLSFLSFLKIVYLPVTVIPMVAAFIAVPIIVGRSLSGIDRTTAQAARIDLDSRGARLPEDDLVDEIRPLVTAINAAFRRVDDGFERRQRFLANAAHELRTPIAILQTRIETLIHSSERTRLLGDVARLAATAEQLLNMQRLSQEDVRLTRLDLVALCRQVVADVAPLAIGAGYELSFASQWPCVHIEGHAPSLSRAVTNLVMNAVEHGEGGGSIGVTVFHDGSLEVADDGPGIPTNQRLRVFEPFYRVRPKTHGAGLGLSLVQQIVERHGGSVDIVDRDKGTCFRMTLRRDERKE